MSEVDWGNLNSISNPNDAYEYFPLKTISIKIKTLQNPWRNKGLLKPSKLKQKLYEKFVKKNLRIESIYKAYKSLF